MSEKQIPLDKAGVPTNVDDWTYLDWLDLHQAIETARRKIAARHARPKSEMKISGQCSHCHKPIGVCQCNRATLEHLRDSSAAHLKEMLATIPAMGSPEPKTITLIGAGGRQDVVNQSEYDALVKSGMMWEFYPDAPHQWPFL